MIRNSIFPKIFAIWNMLVIFLSFVILFGGPSFASAQYTITQNPVPKSITNTPTNTPPGGGCGNPINPCAQKPVVAYGGVESSIRTYLCVPNSGGDKAPSVDPTTGVTIGGTTYGARATNNTDGGDLVLCVNRLYRFGAAIGSFAAVFFIALAGYYYIVAGETGKTKAKSMIISVIAGLVIIFTAFIFLKQINPSLTEFRTIQPPVLSGVPEKYPDCAAIKLGEQCLQPDGTIGVGDGKGGSTTGAGGSKPNCIANKKYSFLCDSPLATDHWPSYKEDKAKATTSSNSTVQGYITKVLDIAKGAGFESRILQVYRPSEYGAHMRSYFEAYALHKGKSDAWVKSHGTYCDGNIQYVTSEDIKKIAAADWPNINADIEKHMNGASYDGTYNTTCDSDHGYGYAVDISNPSAADIAKLHTAGLCHNLGAAANKKYNQDTDGNHFVLNDKNRAGGSCQ